MTRLLREDTFGEPSLGTDPVSAALWDATAPRNSDEHRGARILYDELTNLAMGRGLILGDSYHDDDGRWVVEVGGKLDLMALARRVLAATPARERR